MAIDFSNIFSLKAVPGATQNELRARGSRKWNPSLGQAKTWVHVASLAEGKTYPIGNYATFSSAYRADTNRPKIVIENVKISAKGEYGTTREARIQFVIFDDADFNEFADAYLIPDMSVRVEFGWSVGTDGSYAPSMLAGSSTDPLLDNAAIKAMNSTSAEFPIYEGFQGRVLGWDVKLRPAENAWDVLLVLVGAADAISESSVSSYDDNCICEKEKTGQTPEGENQEVKVNERTTIISAALLELFEGPSAIEAIKSECKGRDDLRAETIAYPGFSRDEEGVEDSDSWFFGAINADLDAEETFISWGTVEALFSYGAAQPVSSTGEPQIFKIDSRGIEVNVPSQAKGRWFSADPRVCILPGGGLTFQEPTEWTDYLAVGVGALLATVTFGASLGVGAAIAASDSAGYGRASTDCFIDDNRIRLTDVMVSTVHLLKRFKEFEQNKTPIMQAINTLLKDINTACGSIWEYEIIDVTDQVGGDQYGGVHLAILDSNAPGAPANNPFIFEANPSANGFCRDISITFKPTDAMKTQALYGANGDNVSDQPPPDDKPCANRFIMYQRKGPRNTGKLIVEKGQRDAPWCNGGTKCDPSKEEEHPVDKLAKEAVGLNIDSARVYLENQKREAEKQALQANGVGPYCRSSILPIGFSATVTGIGGFRWGQSVSCDRLPDEIRTVLNFQVTTVEHNITPEDWTTTINTLARPKPNAG